MTHSGNRVANQSSNTVSTVYDDTNTVVATVPVGNIPIGWRPRNILKGNNVFITT